MPIQSGTHLGPYEIISAIGAGGMGEVYRARDPKLSRDVAIKVLPEAFARDAERMARFQREAKVLASLDHPNIASIYGLEDSGGPRALVMQLVEGPTLADRIKAGPIPVDEAVRIARQIADALEYAHERGIIHRDLKPANVKVSADDTVKVLDFGLAKALESDIASIDISTSPTISRMATMQGVLLGTAAYMAPEQAKAKPVDRRADIWSFGCVLYEMLTGKVAFPGDSVTDTLAGVIRAEPDWSQLPSATPIRVRVLLQRCLQKDPKQRLQAIGDARIALDEVLSGAPEQSSAAAVSVSAPLWRRALPWAVTALTLITLAPVAFLHFREVPPAPAEPVRFQIPPQEKMTLAAGLGGLSFDGRQLVFAATGSDGIQRLWVRALDSLEARPLPGSESPFYSAVIWSPDSRFIAFDGTGKLKKIPVAGGPVEIVYDTSRFGLAVGGDWNRDGVIIFGTPGGGLMRVSASGGPASPLTVVDSSRKEFHHNQPQFLPDGRHFIYMRTSTVPGNSGVYIGSLDAKAEDQSSKQVLATLYGSAFVPSSDPGWGHLLFVQERTLMTQRLDTGRMELSGEPVALAEGVGTFLDGAFFSAANNVLVYRTSSSGNSQLTWYGRQGQTLGTAGETTDLFDGIELSPDGTRVAVSRDLAIMLLEFSRGTTTRFTFGHANSYAPIWSSDGNRIIFASNREGHFDLYEKPASGATDEELLLKSDQSKFPSSWSRDGRFLLYTGNDSKTGNHLWVLPLERDKKPFPFLRTEFNENDGSFSPDGRWIAYSSDESGRDEIYVRPFSPDLNGTASGGGRWQISNGGGVNPHWRGDSKELYFLGSDGKLMAVEVSGNPTFRAEAPRVLFQAPPQLVIPLFSSWDVTQDGKRFLFPAPAAPSVQAPITVVLNWPSLLKK